MIELSNADLLARLRSDEDHFTERKTFKDRNGWLKTAVAFANGAPLDWPGILFIGATSDKKMDTLKPDLDALQFELNRELARAYPPIYCMPKIVTDENGNQCLAVLIPGSSERPHFTGKSYVRVGSESLEASDVQYAELIAHRNSKARKILEHKGERITLEVRTMKGTPHSRLVSSYWRIADCNQFFVSLRLDNVDDLTARSLALPQLEISWDDKNSQLKLVTEE